MNGFLQIFDNLIAKAESNAQQRAKESGRTEHLEADGLLHCDICGDPTQERVTIFGEERIGRVYCSCVRAEMKRKQIEEEREKKRQRVERLRMQGFEKSEFQKYTFEADDGQQPRITKAARAYCQHFEEFREQGRGLVFFGNTGTGKTFIAACIANEIIDRGVSVLMTSFSRIVNKIQNSFDGRQEYIDSLNDFELLIIDDLAAERNTEFVNEIVYQVIDGRYRAKLPMIITTNISLDTMTDDQTARRRIYSRILERCHPIEVAGVDRRKQAFMKNLDEINKILGL